MSAIRPRALIGEATSLAKGGKERIASDAAKIILSVDWNAIYNQIFREPRAVVKKIPKTKG